MQLLLYSYSTVSTLLSMVKARGLHKYLCNWLPYIVASGSGDEMRVCSHSCKSALAIDRIPVRTWAPDNDNALLDVVNNAAMADSCECTTERTRLPAGIHAGTVLYINRVRPGLPAVSRPTCKAHLRHLVAHEIRIPIKWMQGHLVLSWAVEQLCSHYHGRIY